MFSLLWIDMVLYCSYKGLVRSRSRFVKFLMTNYDVLVFTCWMEVLS